MTEIFIIRLNSIQILRSLRTYFGTPNPLTVMSQFLWIGNPIPSQKCIRVHSFYFLNFATKGGGSHLKGVQKSIQSHGRSLESWVAFTSVAIEVAVERPSAAWEEIRSCLAPPSGGLAFFSCAVKMQNVALIVMQVFLWRVWIWICCDLDPFLKILFLRLHPFLR